MHLTSRTICETFRKLRALLAPETGESQMQLRAWHPSEVIASLGLASHRPNEAASIDSNLKSSHGNEASDEDAAPGYNAAH